MTKIPPESSSLNEDSDVELFTWLAPLRRIEPAADDRASIRGIVESGFVRTSPPWWRRTIPVPVPVAAVVVLLFGVMLTQLWSGPHPDAAQQLSQQLAVQQLAQQQIVQTDSPSTDFTISLAASAPAVPSASLAPGWERRESQVYVCGIGRLHSHVELRTEE